MPDSFQLLSKYFWAISLAVSVVNYVVARRKLPVASDGPGQVGNDAQSYLLRFSCLAALPWVVMGVGQAIGMTPNIWHYFRPQDGNLFVIAWFALVFLLSASYAWWVLFRGGAQRMRELDLMRALGQWGPKPPSELAIKLLAAGGVLMVPVWMFFTAQMNVPLPK